MSKRVKWPYQLMCLALCLCSMTVFSATDGVRELSWDDLMPPDWNPLAKLEALRNSQQDSLVDGSPEADRIMHEYVSAGRSAPVVGELNGQTVRLPGFVVPLDFEGTGASEFLLVPYFGACVHVPPPPANQIIYVKADQPFGLKQLFDAVWVTGILRTQAFLNDVGDAGYTMEASTIEPYEESSEGE